MSTQTYQNPVYALGAVVEETGVKGDTLRAWERRYGLPDPARTEGGHRLYSQRDIDTIKWLLARQREGLRMKGAVSLWRGLEAEGRDPLRARAGATRRSRTVTLPPATAPERAGQTLQALSQEWVAACLTFDERRAEQVLTEAFARYPPEMVSVDLLSAGIAQIGQAWYEGQATVQQEHFASALAMRRIESLILAAPPPTRPGRIVAACPPGEQHTLGLLIVTYLLRRRGWETVYLGANVPLARLADFVRRTQPALIVSTAFQLPTAAALLELAQLAQQEGIALAYGGGIVDRPALRERIPGLYLGADLGEVAGQVEEWMPSPPLPPRPPPLPEAYRQALAHYGERQLQIESDLAAQRPDLAREGWFRTAGRELGRHIAAALALGDIDLLGESVTWLEGMGQGEAVPAEVLDDYLRAYRQAARAQLVERGAPVLEWLAAR